MVCAASPPSLQLPKRCRYARPGCGLIPSLLLVFEADDVSDAVQVTHATGWNDEGLYAGASLLTDPGARQTPDRDTEVVLMTGLPLHEPKDGLGVPRSS